MTKKEKEFQKMFIEESTRLTEEWGVSLETGYKPVSNCWGIFSFGENQFSIDNIKCVFEHYFAEFKKLDHKFMTEFVIVMNHKIWQHYKTNEPLAKMYDEYYHKSAAWCEENFNEEQLKYYFETTD